MAREQFVRVKVQSVSKVCCRATSTLASGNKNERGLKFKRENCSKIVRVSEATGKGMSFSVDWWVGTI